MAPSFRGFSSWCPGWAALRPLGRPNSMVETGRGIKLFTSWPAEWGEGERKGGRREEGGERRRVGGRGGEEETGAEKKGRDLKIPFPGTHSVVSPSH